MVVVLVSSAMLIMLAGGDRVMCGVDIVGICHDVVIVYDVGDGVGDVDAICWCF